MTKSKKDNKLIIEKAIKDPDFRQLLVRDNFYWFLHIYLPDYIKFPFAEFHKEVINLLQELDNNAVIAAFRGSGKSTIVSLAYVIWSMIGKKDKRFIVVGSNTTRQAELLMFNIKNILESHDLLKSDLGPFSEHAEEWNVSSLVFKKYDTKIMAISVNESIRGIRYKNKRPDLIILDDVETLDSVKTEENRDKLVTWYDRDIVPLGSEDTNTVVIGTIMTGGSLIDTLKNRIENNVFRGTFKKYPIVDEDGQILWKSRWKTLKSIDDYRKDMGIVNRTWETEYLLNDYIREDQIITEEMIKYYDDLPLGKYPLIGGYVGVDVASSSSPTASKTAIVCGYVFKVDKKPVLYILPNPLNKRISVPDTLQKIKTIVDDMSKTGTTKVFIEDVAYQKSVIQILNSEGYRNVKPYKVLGRDKKMRLEVTVHHLNLGRVLFPRKGAEGLVTQLIRFDFEKHKDLADAYSILVDSVFSETIKTNDVISVDFIRRKYISYDDGNNNSFSVQFPY